VKHTFIDKEVKVDCDLEFNCGSKGEDVDDDLGSIDDALLRLRNVDEMLDGIVCIVRVIFKEEVKRSDPNVKKSKIFARNMK
jgi:hypothetical protein